MTEPLTLRRGAHPTRDAGMCAMEAVAYIAGEPHSDHPMCACPVIAAFIRRWNDGLPDDETRTRLLGPLVPRLVGTRSTPDVERRRAFMVLDWMVREYAPAWMDLRPELAEHAAALRALPEVVDIATTRHAQPVVVAAWEATRSASKAAYRAAWDAAEAAAWAADWDAACEAEAALDAADAAAGDAAWEAARATALEAAEAVAARDAAWAAEGAAARDATDAATVAARDAAWEAARSTAWDAAWAARDAAVLAAVLDAAEATRSASKATWDAACDALAPAIARIQASAIALIERMIAAG